MTRVVTPTTIALVGCLTIAAAQPAQSRYDQGPWCAVFNAGANMVIEDCSMLDFEMCRREALRFGPTSFCIQNPALAYENWQSRSSQPPRPRHHHRHRSHR